MKIKITKIIPVFFCVVISLNFTALVKANTQNVPDEKNVVNVMYDDTHSYIISLGEKYASENSVDVYGGLRYAYKRSYYSVGWNTVVFYSRNLDDSNRTRLFELTFETLPSFKVYCDNTKIEVYEYSTLSEYSLDGVNWQDESTFENLSRKTKYTLYVRTKENVDFKAGTIQTLNVKTK